MADDRLEHIFDRQTMVYGSETGNWYGQCKDCGAKFAVYSGVAGSRPLGAKREEKIHSNAAAPGWKGETLWDDFDEFVAGRPNRLVRYPRCRKRHK